MFKPNRVGTPLIWTPVFTQSNIAWVPNSNANVLGIVEGNVINAAPDADIGATMLSWQGAAVNIPNGEKLALLHQFTIANPIEGNVVGLELSADLNISIETGALIQPIFCKLTAPGAGAILDPVASGIGGIRFDPVSPHQVGGSAAAWRSCNYEDKQVIVRDPTRTDIAGTYAHGFLIVNTKGANNPIDAFHMHGAVRQLNYQPSTGYRDTLR